MRANWLLEAAAARRQEEQMACDVDDLPPENTSGNPQHIWGADRREMLRAEREALAREKEQINYLHSQLDMFTMAPHGATDDKRDHDDEAS